MSKRKEKSGKMKKIDNFVGTAALIVIALVFLIKFVMIDDTRAGYNLGNCRNLTKDAHIVVIFLDDMESSWTDEEVAAFMENKVAPALEFIEKGAAQYGYTIDLSASYRKPEEPLTGNEILTNSSDNGVYNPNRLLNLGFRSLGFENYKEMHKAMQEESGKEQVGYLFAVNKPGRSFARPVVGGVDGLFPSQYLQDPEAAVIYSTGIYGNIDLLTGTNEAGEETEFAAVAHELLHLFGAEDMYLDDAVNALTGKGTVEVRSGRAKLAMELHPHEIMNGGNGLAPDEYMVGDFTAYTVGWLKKLPAVYDVDEWWE